MYRDLEHPGITMALRTGYPTMECEEDEEQYQYDYDSYCDELYERSRDEDPEW